jgi:hypothetical protein
MDAKGMAVSSPYQMLPLTGIDVVIGGQANRNFLIYNPRDDTLYVEEVAVWTSSLVSTRYSFHLVCQIGTTGHPDLPLLVVYQLLQEVESHDNRLKFNAHGDCLLAMDDKPITGEVFQNSAKIAQWMLQTPVYWRKGLRDDDGGIWKLLQQVMVVHIVLWHVWMQWDPGISRVRPQLGDKLCFEGPVMS